MAEPEEIEEDKVEPEPEPEQEIELEFEPIDDPIEAQAIEDVVVDSTGEERLDLKASKTVPLETTIEAPLYESGDASELATTNWRISLREALRENSGSRRKELEAQKESGEIPVTVDIDQIIEDEINEEVQKSQPNMVLAGDATGFNTSRLLKDAPTAYMYQVHEAAEMALLESEETYLDSFIGFFSGIRPEQLIDAEQLVQSRSIQYTNKKLAEKLREEGKTEEEVRAELQKKADEEGTELFEFTYTPFEEERRTYDLPGEALDFKITHEDVDKVATAAGIALGYKQAKALGKTGAALGGKLAGPVGKVGGGFFGGIFGLASGYTMGAMGVKVLEAERYTYEGGPEKDLFGARRAGQFSYDLAKGMLSAFGTVNDIADQLEVSSTEARAALISRSVAAAEAFGLSDKIGKSQAVSDFVEYAKKTADRDFVAPVSPGPMALASILSHPYVGDAIRKKLEGLTDVEKFAVEVALPIPEEGEKTIHQYMADIVGEIQTELNESPEFREAKNLAREEEIKDLSKQLTRERRKREPEYKDWDAIQYFEDIDLGVHRPSDKNKKMWVRSWLYEQSYNDLNPEIRGDQPDVDAFVQFVKLDMAMGGKEYHGNPKIDATLEAIRKGDNKAAVQQLLNSMPLRFINQFRQSNSAGIYQMPSVDKVEKWARDNAKFLEKEVGRKSTREVQRTMQSLMLKKGGSLQYAPSLFGELLQWAALAPTIGAETDIAVDFKDFPDTLLPIVETLGLPTVMGTPAGVDLAEGLGIRNPESTLEGRIRARRKSGTGGFQVGYEEIMLAKGFERGSPEFNYAQNLGFALDMLNVEKYVGRAVGNVGRLGANAIPAGKVFMSEYPENRVALTKRRLLQNTDFDRTEDPTVANHKTLKQNAQAELNEGPNPLDRLDAAERELFSDILIATGRNPDEVFAAFQEAAQVTKYVRRQSEKITRSVDTNDIIVLRNSPEYRALLADLNVIVQAGRIKADDAARFMAMIEAQATRIADATDTPYRSAAEVLGGLRITTNRPARPGARFMGKGLEEVDEMPENAFSQPLGRDNSLNRIRAIMDDLNIQEDEAVFKSNLEKKFGKSNLEDFSDVERIELKDMLFKGQIKFDPIASKPITPAQAKKLKARYEFQTHAGVPEPLTRKSRRKAAFKVKPVSKKTNVKNAKESFDLGDEHTKLLKGRNPLLSDKDWNQWWGGITKPRKETGRVLEPPHKIRTYADPEKLAAELRKLTPEQKRRADGGMKLVEELGALYTTGRAEADVTAQLLAWAILSRSLSAFPHESAFLDIFLNQPPASIFNKDLKAFIQDAVTGRFDEKTMLEFDLWVGGQHRQRAADKLLASGDIDNAQHTFYVGRDAETIDSLLSRKIITEDQAERFKLRTLPEIEANKKANDKIKEKLGVARRDAAALLRNEEITPDEFAKIVGFAPALKIEGAGNPASANLRSFGKNFLLQSSEILPQGHPYAGQTKLAAWHSILLDQSITGQRARRLFHEIYQSSGIDNKVISFMLLAAGRTDVIVIDRIQANHFWGAADGFLGSKVLRKDGSTLDLYEGFAKPSKSAAWDKWFTNPRPYAASRGLADVLSGARGALLYESIENLLLGSIDEAYRLAGREGEGNIGRLHWETWVINSGQEVGHDTLNVILKDALGFDEPAVGAYVSEGKYGMFRYGIKYAVLPDGKQAFVMPTQDGVNYVFDGTSYRSFFDEIDRHKSNVKVEDRVIPKGWGIKNERFENTPWYHRASVDRDNLDKLIRRFGRRATDDENVALDRYSGGTRRSRPSSPRTREAARSEAEFIESKNYAAFEEAKNRNSRPENLAPKTMEEYEGSRVFMIDTEDAGFLVKDGDLQNVFNNSGITGLGAEIVKLSIDTYGAKTLDCFDGFLPKYYSKAGFVEVARLPFVDEFSPPKWDYFKLGRPDVVIMSYQGGDPGMVRNRYGKQGFDYERTNNRLTDFDEAQDLARRNVRDSGDPRGVDGVGPETPRGGLGEQPLRRGMGEDQTHAPVEPTVLRLVEDDDPDTKFQRKQGVPLGYFEYDQRTRKAIINLFEKGDLDTLWHENGHFMATLMGREFTDKIFRYFDNDLMDDGTRKLTDVGHEQFAEAWRYYRRVKDNPNGFVRRLMDELWISLHNLWSRIRKKPGLLPDEVRQYWDLEFGEAPKDRRNVQAITKAALNKRPKYTKLRATQQERILYSPDADKARKRVAMDLGYDSETMHSLLGDRKQNRIRFETDPNTGQRQRVLERSYDPREYDAIDAGLEVYALIKNTGFRKALAGKPMTPVGTGRYHVPVSVLKIVTDKSTNRFIDALGMDPETITKQIQQPNRSGLNSLASVDTIPEGVTDIDIIAYRERFAARYFNESSDQIDKRVRGSGFIVLDDRAQAGLKTLIQEIGNQPEADLIPFSLLDPDANLKLISVDEYNTVRNVVTDIVATPLNRRSRNTAHPGYLMQMASFFENRKITEGIGEALKKLAEWTRKKEEIKVTNADPAMVEIINGHGRMIANAGKSIIRLANDPKLKSIDTLWEFFEHDVSLHTPRVSLSNVRSLFEIVETLDGSIEKMEAKAAARVVAEEEAGKPITATYDPFDLDSAALGKMSPGGGVTLREIGRKIPLMQDLLDGPYGMTPREREAINQLRIFNERLKYAQDTAEFSATDRATIADAIQVIHEGLREKKQYVKEFSEEVFKKILAIKEVSQFDLNNALRIDIYQKFYKGDIKGLLDIATPKKVRRAPEATKNPRDVLTYSEKLKNLGKMIEPVLQIVKEQTVGRYSTKTPELNQALMALMIMLKVDDIKFGLARELAENGYDLSRRSITNNLDLKGEINISRSKYVDRVIFYINRALAKADEVSGYTDPQSGRKARTPEKPEKKNYGPTEKPSTKRQDSAVITRIDKSAQYEADQILKRAGIRIDEGTADIIMLGSKQFIMPKNMIDQLESWAQETYPNSRFKKTWGRTGRAEYHLEIESTSVTNINRIEEQIANAALVWQRAAEFLVSPRTFYSGLLIGVGGLPMVGYGMGVFIGGLSQVHLGQGVLAATRDFIEAPGTGVRVASEVTPLVRKIAEAADVEIEFVSGTLARLFGDGSHRPRTKPLVLPDGRIITADMLANTVDRYGWKSAFADALASNNLYDQFYERFTKANPTWINGAMFGVLGAPLGPQSALLSAAFGMTMAQSLKPGNIFSKAHRFYRESFVAIDTYMRIKVLVRELKAGATLDDGAKNTRKIMLDYSDLSDAEASYMKRYFAFYTYFSQANKFLFTSLIENPDRVITQLKFARNTQLKATESKDPDLMLSPWDRYRSFLPFEIMGQRFRLPFLLTGDSVGLLLEVFLAAPFTGGEEEATAARLGLFSRAAPQLGLAAAMTFEIDPGLGFPLERATLQVPAELVEFDLEFTGGTLHDILGIEYIQPKNIRHVWDEKEKRRVNERNIEMPGRGIWVAKNTSAYLFLMDYLQSPLTGRMGDNLWALSRANAGVVEGMMDLTHALKSLNPDKPILSNIGALQVLGFVKEKDIRRSVPDNLGVAQAYASPTDPGLSKVGAREAVKQSGQITTASIPTLKKYGVAYKSEDGSTYNVYADQFYPTELGRTIGFSAWHPQSWEKLAYWKYKQHAQKSAAKIKENEAQQAVLELTAPIDNEQ